MTDFRIDNKQLVSILKEVLAAMEVLDVNKFRIRAYQNVITSIENLTIPVFDLWKNNRLDEVSGVGGTLTQHLTDLFTTGRVSDFEDVKKNLPQGMFALLGIRGIGAKKAHKLAVAFNLTDRASAVDKLKEAATGGKIQELEGFGVKSEQDILAVITDMKMHKKEKPRMLYVDADEISSRIITHLKMSPYVVDAQALGSYRRKEATVGDLDIACSVTDPALAVEHFLIFPEIGDILNKGDKGARVVLTNDVQVDMRVTKPEAYGAMLQYFTGSKMHNVELRTYALESGKSLSEYGIKFKDKLHEFPDESSFYKFIGLPCIPPELRQGSKEIALAKKDELPELITLGSIKGDLHMHTTASDGENTLEDMVKSAVALNYHYIGISDHAPSVVNRGFDEVLNIISTQKQRIEHLNDSYLDIKLLFGYEVNILVDATLALPDELMAKLDYVIASIHTGFTQDRATITKRLINAIENPYVKVIGHPSGRQLNKRPSIDADWDKVLDAAAANGKMLEINSQPERLDLSDDLIREAVKKGVKLIIGTDAHNTKSLTLMEYGINMARRGFCIDASIVNTLPLADFLRLLRGK